MYCKLTNIPENIETLDEVLTYLDLCGYEGIINDSFEGVNVEYTIIDLLDVWHELNNIRSKRVIKFKYLN
jgi:hypothetical protein